MAESTSPDPNTRLHVANLAWSVGDDELRELFAECGSVMEARVVRDKRFDRSRGYGFVLMSTVDEAKNAIESLSGREYEGRPIEVDVARSTGPYQAGSGPAPDAGVKREVVSEEISPSARLYARELAWDIDDTKLAEHFAAYGEVAEAHVVTFGRSGRSRGYGFVTFADEKDAAAALEGLNGVELEGRAIEVAYAKPVVEKSEAGPKKTRRTRRRSKKGADEESKEDEQDAGEVIPAMPVEEGSRLYLSGLDWDTTVEVLTENLRAYGEVRECRILKDTRRHHAYAFVVYDRAQEANEAIQSLNGAEIEGAVVSVELAKSSGPRPRRNGRARRGRRRAGGGGRAEKADNNIDASGYDDQPGELSVGQA